MGEKLLALLQQDKLFSAYFSANPQQKLAKLSLALHCLSHFNWFSFLRFVQQNNNTISQKKEKRNFN